jgi:hypothetical protein
MPEENRKLSPAEFLSELKGKPAPSDLLELSPAKSADDLDLDFSDLDEDKTAPEENTGEQNAGANGRPGSATAEARTDRDDDAENAASSDSSDDNNDNDDYDDAEAVSIENTVDDSDDSQPVDSGDESSGEHLDSEEESEYEEDEEYEGEEGEEATPGVVQSDAHLAELFSRVHSLLGGAKTDPEALFTPHAPETLEQTGLSFEDVERLVMKYLFARGSASGRQVCAQIRLPFNIIDPVLKQLKQDQLLAFKGTATMGDYEYGITEPGRERARGYSVECSYFGPAPVCLHDYLEAMADQSITKQHASEEDLQEAFSDLIISQELLERLGPAINSGRGMFIYGEPGNGKTSIAERITRSFPSAIWIPRTLAVDGEIIRVFDPGVHEEIKQMGGSGLFDLSGIDQRWVQILRPTVIAGGELTMAELEVTQNPQTRICEAPLQLKSNCGTLVIDDFGRQRMPVEELLNRWIVPLEKRYDYLNMPSGKKVQVPFDQLIIFSTNLEPKDLVDGAFLRRIPYKIEAKDPTYDEFHQLFQLMAPTMGFTYDRKTVDYLIETHYKAHNWPFRACQPRDLLQQVKNFCTYKNLPKQLTPEAFDFAVANYFSVM